MCILCDLETAKSKEDRERARCHVIDIIKTCERIAGNYRSILMGNLKPHSEEMKKAMFYERHLVRLLINDLL